MAARQPFTAAMQPFMAAVRPCMAGGLTGRVGAQTDSLYNMAVLLLRTPGARREIKRRQPRAAYPLYQQRR
eukprot:3210638-Rhodomonas_salina.1